MPIVRVPAVSVARFSGAHAFGVGVGAGVGVGSGVAVGAALAASVGAALGAGLGLGDAAALADHQGAHDDRGGHDDGTDDQGVAPAARPAGRAVDGRGGRRRPGSVGRRAG